MRWTLNDRHKANGHANNICGEKAGRIFSLSPEKLISPTLLENVHLSKIGAEMNSWLHNKGEALHINLEFAIN